MIEIIYWYGVAVSSMFFVVCVSKGKVRQELHPFVNLLSWVSVICYLFILIGRGIDDEG